MATLSDDKTIYRISSKSYTKYNNLKTFVGCVRWYEDGRFLWSESTGIHCLTAMDARDDALNLVNYRLETGVNI